MLPFIHTFDVDSARRVQIKHVEVPLVLINKHNAVMHLTESVWYGMVWYGMVWYGILHPRYADLIRQACV